MTTDATVLAPAGSNGRFSTLNSIGQVLVVIGWIAAAGGLLVGLFLLNEMGISGLLVVFVAPIYGVLVVAYGEALQCLVTVARSTERTAELLAERA